MKGQQALQSDASPVEQTASRADVPHGRVYTAAQIIEKLQISPSHFFNQKRLGRLPCLDEIRVGRSVRYRADLVDRFVAGRKVR